MKRIWYAVIITAIVAAICIYENLLINNTADSLENHIDAAVSALESGDKKTALEYSDKIKNEWNKSESAMNYLLSHEMTDKINDRLCTFYLLIEDGDSMNLRISAERLKLNLQVIKDGERILGENFF